MKELIDIITLTEEEFEKIKDKRSVEQEYGGIHKYEEIYEMLLEGEKIQSLEFTSKKIAHKFYIAIKQKIRGANFPNSIVLIRKNHVIINKEK